MKPLYTYKNIFAAFRKYFYQIEMSFKNHYEKNDEWALFVTERSISRKSDLNSLMKVSF